MTLESSPIEKGVLVGMASLVVLAIERSRLNRLIQDLLEMARIEAKEMQPQREWCFLPEMLKEVVSKCKMAGSNHPVRLVLDERMRLVSIDERLISEVLVTLIENASKFSPPGSEIAIRAELSENNLLISVSDQGIGIQEGDLNQIFDKFFQGSQPSTVRRSGTGMGLAIAKGIIEAHGGRIWANSSPGKGTTFSISIPVETKEVSSFSFLNH